MAIPALETFHHLPLLFPLCFPLLLVLTLLVFKPAPGMSLLILVATSTGILARVFQRRGRLRT
jgi:Kef-type K+ transport system membrane component KefB